MPFWGEGLTASNAVVLQWHFIVFTKWMPFPVFRAENPTQVRVSGEQNTGEIEGLAFVPIGRCPAARGAGT